MNHHGKQINHGLLQRRSKDYNSPDTTCCDTWPQGFKTFILNLDKHEVLTARKYLNKQNKWDFKVKTSKPDIYPANKCKHTNTYCHFNIYEQDKGGRALSPFFGPLQKPKYESYRTTISSRCFIS